jgi:hypothetical protein
LFHDVELVLRTTQKMGNEIFWADKIDIDNSLIWAISS